MTELKKEKTIKERIAKLIDLKSIITISLVGGLTAGWFTGHVTSEQYIPIVTMTMTFYFAKTDKKEE